jgi:hypothetical protein
MADNWNQQELWEAVQKYGGYRPAGRALGIPESTIRSRLRGFEPELPAHAFVPDATELPAPHIEQAGVETVDYWASHEQTGGVRRYILTSAQNNCRVHEGFLANLKALAAEVDAELLVSCTIYDKQGYRGLVRKGDQGNRSREVWWDQAIKPYMVNARCRLHRRLAFCGELDILATAKRPLSGLDSYCGRSSVIVPHNRFAFRCVESRQHQMPKELATTGSVTLRKFIQRKAGQIAHFHHVLGALLVEVDEDGYWFTHHLNAEEDGSFYWLDRRVEDGRVKRNPEGLAGLVLGDVHSEKLSLDQRYLVGTILDTLSPDHLFVHDLIDFESRNHHTRDDPLFRVRTHSREQSVVGDLRNAADILKSLTATVSSTQVVVIASNHHEAFGRWIREADWRADPENAEIYLQTALEMVRAAQSGCSLDPFQWYLQTHLSVPESVKFLRVDDSYEVCGIECGIHGHVGLSGSRGSPRSYSKLGFKTITGHTHTPSIMDGCYTVGVMGSLQMGYNRGPSKWMHAHCGIYPNGKRTFLWSKGGRWRAPLE